MAIFHLSAKVIQRSKGRSATASAAYRAGECIEDERTGQVHDYTKKRGVEHSEIITPNGDKISRSELWNAAEQAEKRKDGTPAREYELALPAELSPEQRQELVREFAQDLAQRYGCVVDLAIHAPGREGDQRNYHVHLLCTTRCYEPGCPLGKKCDVELSDTDRQKKGLPGRKAELEATREKWATLCNAALERAGSKERISHKSLTAQGIDRDPAVHLGPTVTAMERRGVQTDRGDLNLSVQLVQEQKDRAVAAERAEEKQKILTPREENQKAKQVIDHRAALLEIAKQNPYKVESYYQAQIKPYLDFINAASDKVEAFAFSLECAQRDVAEAETLRKWNNAFSEQLRRLNITVSKKMDIVQGAMNAVRVSPDREKAFADLQKTLAAEVALVLGKGRSQER